METSLATRQDLTDTRLALKQDIQDVRVELRQDIALLEQKMIQMEQRLTIKLGTIVSIAIGVAVALSRVAVH